MKKRLTAAMAGMLMLSGLSLHAQTTATSSVTTPAKHKARKKAVAAKKVEETEEHQAIRELQEKMAAQQAQIDALTQQNAAKDAALAAAQSTAAAAKTQAADATAQAQSAATATQTQADTVTGLKSTVTDLQTANAGLATTISATKTELNDKIDSPAALHYKGVTITPGGFAAFEGVYRERSVNSDINTPFNSIPFPSANEGHVSEFNLSGRQSRLSALIEANTGQTKLTGYYEMDWLGTGTSSNNNQSNSYVLRQRQIWGQAATTSGFTVTGGQMWSLTTEDRKGLDPRTEIQPQTIDSQYLVGYTWTRQPELRLEQRFGDAKSGMFTAGMSLEQAQITNFTANGTVPNQYYFGGLGQNGGLYNAAESTASVTCSSTSTTLPVGVTCATTTGNLTSYANNVAPDVIVKGAFDAPLVNGLPVFHVEVGGIARFLRDEYYPVTTTFTTPGTPIYTYPAAGSVALSSHTSDAGGVFGSARVYLQKYAEVAVQGMAGTGVGRYGSAQLADATLRPDETLEPIRNYHGLFSVETHLNPKFDVFAYYGGEYAQRTVYTTAAGNLIGYAPPNLSDTGCYNLPAAVSTTVGTGAGGTLGATSCGSPTKYIQEGMIGFQYRPITSPKYGRLQYSATYSIIQRQLWGGIGSASTPTSPRAQDSMVHVQMRYYIP
jgi:hypothetical protein